jgi:CRISPR-associated protein Cmr6
VLFGAPDAIDAGASAGSIIFHDALYVPLTSAPDRPFAVDVLTVHQKDYYNSAGKTWPNDFDNPNPVSFLTVRPKTKLLFAVSEQPDSMPEGSPSWAELVERLLRDALSQWGIGGKTSAGYGRLLDPISPATAGGVSPSTPAGKPVPKHSIGDRISVERRKDPSGKVKFFADDGFPGHFPNKQEEPSGDIGEKLDVWIANKNLQGYSLTRREPRSHDKGKRR